MAKGECFHLRGNWSTTIISSDSWLSPNVADGTKWKGSCSGEVITMLRPLGRLVSSFCLRESAYISFSVNKCVRSETVPDDEEEDLERSESAIRLGSTSSK